jgi:predicted permease
VRSFIVVAEVGLSLVLVAQAGWLLRSFIRLHQEPLGFRTENVVTIPLTPTGIQTTDEWARRMEGMRAALAETPGVRGATFGLSMPLQWTGGTRCCWSTRIDFGGGEGPVHVVHPVESSYFDVLGLDVLAGRSWTGAEANAVPRPAVVTEPLALHAFGSAAAALGRSFVLAGTSFYIMGVAADNRHYGPDQEHGPALYVPIAAMPFVPIDVHMAVLTADPPAELPTLLRAAVWRSEPELPVPTIRPMSEWISTATAESRFASALFAVFAGVALLLVAGGLSGTLLYMVRLQRRDLGIRLALGATAGRLERRVLLRGLATAAIGGALGAAGAWATGRLLESRLFGVDARDFRTLALATMVLLLTALFASWIPARRAAATDPMDSLRAE